MREIDFRGKRVGNGGWVYGTPIYDGNIIYILSGVVEANEEYICIEEWCPVVPETIGQYTGLKDKNGVEIYEGDIVAGEFYFRGEGWFDTGEGEFTINDPVIFKDGKFICRGFDLCEINDDLYVIGNIHDNHAKRDTEG